MKHIKLFENFEDADAQNTKHVLSKILNSYLEAALWTESDTIGDDFTIYDFDDDSREAAKIEISNFMSKANQYLVGIPEDSIGHDIWLTRNRHGAGFWDRDYLDAEAGKVLTDLAHEMGERSLFTKNGKVYIE